MTAEVLMATPCTQSLGCESRGHKHGGDEGRRLCWKCAAVSAEFLGDEIHLVYCIYTMIIV